MFRLTSVLLAAIAIALGCQACGNENDEPQPVLSNALVTCKTAADGTFYMQLDDKTTLLPVNVTKSPFGDKEVRALTTFAKVDDAHVGYSAAAKVYAVDSILTKQMAPSTADNAAAYGEDPLEIVRDWVTICEDGYLTLRFRTKWGGTATHSINLVASGNADNPYEVELRQDAKGDTQGAFGDALVAFNLSSLPDTNGKTVKLKIKWKSYSGDKSVEFDYCSRASGGSTDVPVTDLNNNKRLE